MTRTDTDTATYACSARRWRDSHGNTYHTTLVWATDKPQDAVWLPAAYGYGRHYLTTAQEWLSAQGVEISYRDLIDEGATDVKRKRDL